MPVCATTNNRNGHYINYGYYLNSYYLNGYVNHKYNNVNNRYHGSLLQRRGVP